MQVLIFGVFDMLHPGHVYFIEQAKKQGKDLHICLATDEYVKKFKNKETINNFDTRKEMILKKFPNITIYKGDDEIGQWSIFKKIKPDLIVLGYDQNGLFDSLNSLNSGIKILFTEPHLKDIYNTTKLQKLN